MKFLSKLQTFFVTTRRISLGLAVLKFTRALLSIYSVILSAKYFGASFERDTWVLAGSAVAILTQLMFGPINEIFRAKFIHIRAEEGEERALAATGSLLYAIIVVSLLVIALVETFPGLLSGLFAPGFKGAERHALSLMIRWIIPALLLNQITLIWIALLNAYRSYFIPDIYSLISGGINVVCILVLAQYIGIYSLIVANYLEIGILAFILLIALLRVGKNVLTWSRPRWSLIRPFVLTSFPFYLSYLAGNAQMAIERMLSTYLGVGNVSVLDYARKFIDMPTGVIVGVITTMLTPTLAELFIQDKFAELSRESIKFMRMLILGLIPFVVLCSVCSREMVELLLVRGSFKREFIDVTSQSLTFFCLGSVGYIFYAVGAQSLIAQKKAAFYAMVGSASTAVSIAMNLTLFKVAGLLIFPVSWGLTLFLSGVYMVFCSNCNRLETFREIAKMLCLLALVIALGYAVRAASLQVLGAVSDLKKHDFLVVLATALFGNLLYLLAAYLLNLEEIQGVRRYLAGRR
jgi:peptidoglycan biosynthesis protein MviN/MurJ (putative lipid II flippase)